MSGNKEGAVNPVGGSGTDEGRDSWCTPKWLAELIGEVEYDVCTNPRAHIRATRRKLMLENDDDGLPDKQYGPGFYVVRSRNVDMLMPAARVFCNPPYARGQVIRWVRHWRHTRFIYLLRWDPSTEWFGELICHCTHVWFPARRINFEPPPGVKSSSNPFPHALFLKDPPPELLDRLGAAGYLMPIDQDLLALYLDGDDQRGFDSGNSDKGEAAEGGALPGGGGAGGLGEGIAAWIPYKGKPPVYAPFAAADLKEDKIDAINYAINYARIKTEGTATKCDCASCKAGRPCVFKTKWRIEGWIK